MEGRTQHLTLVSMHSCGHSSYLLPVHCDQSVCMLSQLIHILNKTLAVEHIMPNQQYWFRKAFGIWKMEHLEIHTSYDGIDSRNSLYL